ncbi:hypothetical protein Trydic_g9727 [Trypoxylus dichotomus]
MNTTLELLQPFKPHSIELIDSAYPISQDDLKDYLLEESRPCTSEEEELGGILDMKYEEYATNYWKSGKKIVYIESVQRRFRKVNSLRNCIDGR